ncbi:MAG: MBL fold metallo-hydrolase [Pseudorhodoplanes sp.]
MRASLHLFAAFLAISTGALLSAVPASQGAGFSLAQAKPEMRESCPGLVARAPQRPQSPLFRRTALAADEVQVLYVGHSTFLLESPQGVRIATDYNDYVKPSVIPDVITMNHAHSTHYTDFPDPAIRHVLRGWAAAEHPARHDFQLKDVHIRNVPTNIRRWESGGTERHGNSIFIFEIGSLCIAHLGHLHHTLTQQQLDEIGRVDVVLVPVDGSYTLDLDGMIEVLASLKAPLMIPMHYFSAFTLNRFVDRIRQTYEVSFSEKPSVVLSNAGLPASPQLLVLPGR